MNIDMTALGADLSKFAFDKVKRIMTVNCENLEQKQFLSDFIVKELGLICNMEFKVLDQRVICNSDKTKYFILETNNPQIEGNEELQ